MSSTINSLAKGVSFGTGITGIKRIEDSYRAGRNAPMIAMSQTAQVHYSLSMADKALALTSLNEVPLAGRIVAYLTPATLAFFIKRGIDSPSVRQCALFIQNAIGNLCQLAALVSSIALIAFNHLAIGITACTFVSLGFLDRNGFLPEWISYPLHEYSSILQVSMGLIVGDVVEKIFALTSVVAFCYEKYLNSNLEPVELDAKISTPKETLDLSLLEKILAGTVELEVNPHHLSMDTHAPAPNVSVSELMTLFEQIDWSQISHLNVVKAKFKDDERFVELNGNPDDYPKENLIAMVRSNLQAYVDSIVNKHMDGGPVHNYQRLETYVKVITYQLAKEDEMTQVDTLVQLAVDGGNYCGPRKFHLAEDLYCRLALKCDTVPTETKVLLRLQEIRTNWFMAIRDRDVQAIKNDERCWVSLLTMFMHLDDLHMYNLFLNMYGPKFGLRRASADNDFAAVVDPFSKELIKKITGDLQPDFDAMYSTEFISRNLRDDTGTSSIPRPDIFSWWNDWIERQDIEPNRKDELREGIEAATLLGVPMQTGLAEAPGPFNRKLLQAMAVDMGILKVRPA